MRVYVRFVFLRVVLHTQVGNTYLLCFSVVFFHFINVIISAVSQQLGQKGKNGETNWKKNDVADIL